LLGQSVRDSIQCRRRTLVLTAGNTTTEHKGLQTTRLIKPNE
jgi:hypothetical protein